MSGKEFVTTNMFKDNQDQHPGLYDTTRDWYLKPRGDGGGREGRQALEAYTDDIEDMTSSARQLNDWRKALDFSQDWKWSTAAQTMVPAPASTITRAAGAAAPDVRA